MGGDSTSKTSQTQNTSNSFAPWVTSAGQDLYNTSAAQVAAHPYQGYGGPTQGQFGQGTGIATDWLKNAIGTNGGVNADTTGASDAFKQVIGSIDPNASVSSYMNPYTAAVLSPTLRNINESADQQRMQNGASAAMAGAWGSSGMSQQQAIADRNREMAIGDATGAAYGKAFDSATQAKQSALQSFLSASQGEGAMGAQAGQQGTTLATMLAGLGSQEQQANQTGINTAIGVNDSNQMGAIKQGTSLAQMLAMLPKNTTGTSVSNGTTSTPDNSGMALFGSILGSII